MSDDELLARVALSRCVEPGDAVAGRWIEEVGAIDALADLRRGRCPLRRAEAYANRLGAAAVEPAVDVDAADAAGARVVVPGSPAWPTQLDDLGPRRPLLLWVRGPADLRTSALCSVALVGARSATGYGVAVATGMAADLAGLGWTVVSGGAYGIDAAAHRGALAVDGVTVAVLATGADRIYPQANDALLARVLDTGSVITELPPGERPTRPRFLERNRVVAALTRGTVVVEAARRSGALSTAARANELARPVMAVPGPVTSAVSAGSHRLIRDHEAVLVGGADDVLELLGPISADGSDTATDGAEPLDRLDPEFRLVHEALPARGVRSLTEVAARAGLDQDSTLGLLADLRVRGLAERVDGGWRSVRR